jgi:hypothetical protein
MHLRDTLLLPLSAYRVQLANQILEPAGFRTDRETAGQINIPDARKVVDRVRSDGWLAGVRPLIPNFRRSPLGPPSWPRPDPAGTPLGGIRT